MKVLSVNVGRPQEREWRGVRVRTAIFKSAVEGPVAVGKLDLEGDEQGDITVHGGPDKAVYAYPYEHYAYWQAQLPGYALAPGNFGENLTITGVSEESIHIGDTLQIGTARFAVTQPRTPCYKLGVRFDREDMTRRFYESRRLGFYLRVLRRHAPSRKRHHGCKSGHQRSQRGRCNQAVHWRQPRSGTARACP
jgi:MOSC domain-containing protein YiiM